MMRLQDDTQDDTKGCHIVFSSDFAFDLFGGALFGGVIVFVIVYNCIAYSGGYKISKGNLRLCSYKRYHEDIYMCTAAMCVCLYMSVCAKSKH